MSQSNLWENNSPIAPVVKFCWKKEKPKTGQVHTPTLWSGWLLRLLHKCQGFEGIAEGGASRWSFCSVQVVVCSINWGPYGLEIDNNYVLNNF